MQEAFDELKLAEGEFEEANRVTIGAQAAARHLSNSAQTQHAKAAVEVYRVCFSNEKLAFEKVKSAFHKLSAAREMELLAMVFIIHNNKNV